MSDLIQQVRQMIDARSDAFEVAMVEMLEEHDIPTDQARRVARKCLRRVYVHGAAAGGVTALLLSANPVAAAVGGGSAGALAGIGTLLFHNECTFITRSDVLRAVEEVDGYH